MHHPFSATSSRFRASVPMQRLTRRLWHFLDAKVRNLSDLESILKKFFSFRVGLTADNHAACSGFIAPAALLRLTCQLKPESSHHRRDKQQTKRSTHTKNEANSSCRSHGRENGGRCERVCRRLLSTRFLCNHSNTHCSKVLLHCLPSWASSRCDVRSIRQ